MRETEAKFYVQDLKGIKSRLRKINAQPTNARVLEKNIRFDLPDHSLRKAGRVLRLREDAETRMTYKGASEKEDGVLSREEIEFGVEDFKKAERLLESLGYVRLFYYEKYRTTYRAGKVHIMLDEMPYGDFVEIEGPDPASIHRVADRLNLIWDAVIPTSYHLLFERLCEARKLKFRELSFKNFKGLKIGAEDLGVKPADIPPRRTKGVR
jgi:adenylate cyclase class 2